MRLVQRAVLPRSQQVHLAEFFSIGLLQRVSGLDGDAEDILYDFDPGIRELLLAAGRLRQLMEVQRTVSKHIADRFGQVFDFDAYVADPRAFLEPATHSVDRAFATVAAAVLRQLGGLHREIADRFEFGTASTPSTPPGPEQHQPPADQNFHIEVQEQSNWAWCATALTVRPRSYRVFRVG